MADSDSTRGMETILVVEDDTSVRRYLQMALRIQGYAILEADGSEKALQISDSHAGDIHLLISDVNMPGMNGMQLAELLGARRPGIKVLLLSGYPEEDIREYGIKANTAFLQKPFTPTELTDKMHELLG
jgi:CheY-like chemotaxis protein